MPGGGGDASAKEGREEGAPGTGMGRCVCGFPPPPPPLPSPSTFPKKKKKVRNLLYPGSFIKRFTRRQTVRAVIIAPINLIAL